MKVAWFVLAAVLAAAEIALPGFVLLPFGIGAVGAAVAALAGADLLIQLVVFLLVSIVAFAALRPVAARLNRGSQPAGVGANRLIDQQGSVLEQLGPDDPGLVRIDRETWRAESADGSTMTPGTSVRVVEVRGTRVFVIPQSPE
ncbi:MAG: NfeD family protein [Microthrixaceae bacterium]|nr:NfeD family protein [Microthrixaceae bacterium]